MSPRELVPREGEIAVIGLARSGRAAAMLLRKHGYNVYASDVASSPETGSCAEELRAKGIIVDVGRHDLERLERASLVVASPGVPPSARPLAFAREKGIRVASEVEVALNFLETSLSLPSPEPTAKRRRRHSSRTFCGDWISKRSRRGTSVRHSPR